MTQVINGRDHGAVGDGVTDDSAALNAAYALLAAGDTLYLPAGVYVLATSALLVNRPHTVVCGDGPSSVLQLAAGASYQNLGWQNLIEATAADCVLRGLCLDGNWAGNPTIDAHTPRDSNQHGVYALGALRLRVERCRFINNRRTPILIADGCPRYEITDNQCVGYTVGGVGVDDCPGTGNSGDPSGDTTSRFGISINSNSGSQTSSINSSHGLIRGNTISDFYRAIMCKLPDTRILDNAISGTSRTYDCNQIELYNSQAPYPVRCQVRGNRLNGAWSQALQLSACDGTICTDNHLIGIAAEGVTPPVNGSLPSQAYNMGIQANCPNLTIAHNYLSDFRAGVYLQTGAVGARVCGNQVLNTVTDTAQLGIALYSQARAALLDGNYVERGGIIVTGDGYTVAGNHVYPRDAGNSTVGYAPGIWAGSGTTNARLLGNLVDGIKADGTYPTAGDGGIRCDSPVRLVLTGNTVRNMGHYGVGVSGGTDCVLANNQVADNGSSGAQRYGCWINGGTRITVAGTNATESGAGGRDPTHRQQYGLYASAPLVEVQPTGTTGAGNTDALVRVG